MLCWLGFFGWFLSSLCVHSRYEDAGKKKKKSKQTPSKKNTHAQEEEEEEDARTHNERERDGVVRSARKDCCKTIIQSPHQNTHQNTIFFKFLRENGNGCTYVANWEPLRALSCAAPLVGWIRKMPKNTPPKKTFRPPQTPPPQKNNFTLMALVACSWPFIGSFMRKLGLS